MPDHRHRRTLVAAFALAPAAALAQPAAPAAAASAPEATLPAIRATATVERETATGPVRGTVARRSATATKTDTPLAEVPQSITVIGAEQIRDQNAQTMQEALRYTPGVRHELYGLDNRGDWFALRGGSEGSVLLDGLRVPLTGWYGVVRNEPYAFERIEVLRGPASLVAGQNGPGGVVNMVSKRPLADAQREVALQVGENALRQVAADLTGPLDADGRWLYRLVALHKDSGTQVDFADERRRFVAPSLTWKPRPGTTLTLFGEWQEDRSGNTNAFFGIEGTRRRAPNGFIPPQTFIGEPDWDRYGGTRERFGWQLEQRLGETWTLRHSLRRDRVEGEQRSMYAAWWLGFADASGAADPNGRYLNRIWYASDDDARVSNAELLLEGRLQFGRTRHTLLVGVDTMRNDMRQRSWDGGAATPLDVYDPVYGSFPEPDWASLPSGTTRTRVRNTGVLVQDQIRIDERWVVVAGLRRDRTRSETLDGGGGPQRDAATTKNLGLVRLADGGWSPYLGYSESFEPVAGRTVDGDPFVPKRGRQIEAGLKWAPAGSRLSAAAAVYRLKELNRPVADPNLPAGDPSAQIQAGEITVQGVELEFAANLRAWDLLASLSWTDAQQTEVGAGDERYLGEQLGSVPKTQAAVWALHRVAALPGLRAGGGVRHVGEVGDGAGGTTVPAVTLLDLLVDYETGPWRLAFNVANATDKTYLATCLERGDCWFGTKRRAVLSAAYRW